MNHSLKKKADFIPLLILIVSACYLLWSYLNGQILLSWKHILGFVLLTASCALFLKYHKAGVLCVGLTILLGVFGILSFSPSISTMTIGKSLGGDDISLLYFQPIFLLWAVIYFAVSARYYTGILTKRYWQNIKSDEVYKIK
jgi:ABC-type transport system involved in cytochrome c biogenesis permease component